ncbi:MAG: chemotaxis response regulator protein-glutamate methylesterase [Gemmatimonadota bacterium]|nr:chemotaxis response regulator protein-glutamate methylesterase [Gemmatimonadota bacterium]MDH5803930.1 chemotaxis response regulator protein-glutamate methylesterase [Gemmatimonadota bacterium]
MAKQSKKQDERPLNVLVVDDSAVMRQAMLMLLPKAGNMEVTVAADPVIAQEKIKKNRPDVILLDLEMPRMDGLTFLKKQMAEDPIPVVVCSTLAHTDAAVKALAEGATEVIAKPEIGLRGFLEDSAILIVDTIHAAAGARIKGRPKNKVTYTAPQEIVRPKEKHTADVVLPKTKPALGITTEKVIAIGASTGGTEALTQILTKMPPDAPGIVIVQHMPEKFTAAFAERIDGLCRIKVKEAETGDRVTPGKALIAPGNRHTIVERSGAQYHVTVKDGPLVSRHRPSVDVLFRSVAQVAGRNAVGVILTGMGDDGSKGMLEMKENGAYNIAQDEKTSVVFGMPKEAINIGAVDEVIPLHEMAETITKRAKTRPAVRR